MTRAIERPHQILRQAGLDPDYHIEPPARDGSFLVIRWQALPDRLVDTGGGRLTAVVRGVGSAQIVSTPGCHGATAHIRLHNGQAASLCFSGDVQHLEVIVKSD